MQCGEHCDTARRVEKLTEKKKTASGLWQERGGVIMICKTLYAEQISMGACSVKKQFRISLFVN